MPPLVSAPTSIPEPHLHSSHVRKQSQHSSVAKSAIMSGLNVANRDPSREAKVPVPVPVQLHVSSKDFLIPPAKSTAGRLLEGDAKTGLDAPAATIGTHRSLLGTALTDTPASTAPNSPRMYVILLASLSSLSLPLFLSFSFSPVFIPNVRASGGEGTSSVMVGGELALSATLARDWVFIRSHVSRPLSYGDMGS